MVNLMIDEMKKNNVTPNVVTYDVLISGYKRLGHRDKVRDVFKEMKEKGILPDKTTAYICFTVNVL